MSENQKTKLSDKILMFILAVIALFGVGYTVKTRKELKREKNKNAKLQFKNIDQQAQLDVQNSTLDELVDQSNEFYKSRGSRNPEDS